MQISAVDLVLRVAGATVGASESPPNTNAGPFVERCQATTGNAKGAPWCASFVCMVGRAALGDTWPVLRSGGCQALHDWAAKKGILTATPAAGSVFLIWHAELGRFAHTGFVVGQVASGWTTIEGNTSGGGSREGWLVAERTRRFKPADRFIDWSSLMRELA